MLEVYLSHQGPLYLFYEALREHPQISESTAIGVELAFDTYELVYHWIPLVRTIFAYTGKHQWHTVEELAIVGIHNRPHPGLHQGEEQQGGSQHPPVVAGKYLGRDGQWMDQCGCARDA